MNTFNLILCISFAVICLTRSSFVKICDREPDLEILSVFNIKDDVILQTKNSSFELSEFWRVSNIRSQEMESSVSKYMRSVPYNRWIPKEQQLIGRGPQYRMITPFSSLFFVIPLTKH